MTANCPQCSSSWPYDPVVCRCAACGYDRQEDTGETFATNTSNDTAVDAVDTFEGGYDPYAGAAGFETSVPGDAEHGGGSFAIDDAEVWHTAEITVDDGDITAFLDGTEVPLDEAVDVLKEDDGSIDTTVDPATISAVGSAMADILNEYIGVMNEAAEAMNEALVEAFGATLAEAAEAIDEDDEPDTYNDDPDESVADLLAEPRKRTEPIDEDDHRARVTGDAYANLPPKRLARDTPYPSEWPTVTGDMAVFLDGKTRDPDDLPADCEARTCDEPSEVAVRFRDPAELVAYCDGCAEDKIAENEDKFDGGFRL